MKRPARRQALGSGPEPVLGVALAVLGLAAVVLIAGSSTLGTSIRLGLVPAGGVIAGLIVLRYRDGLERRRHQAALESALAEIEVKSHLLAGVAHEIQDPLTSLLGLSELLRDNPSMGTGEANEFIEMIHTEAADLAMLAEDLYVVSAGAFSGVDGHGLTRVDLYMEVERAAATIDRRQRSVLIRGHQIAATTDLARLRHVLRSLLANVERFGGKNVEIVVERRMGKPTIVVSDDGPPVDHEAVAAMGAGGNSGRTGRTGLRISIAAMMAESLGASLDYARSPGWTNFVLSLEADGSRFAAR